MANNVTAKIRDYVIIVKVELLPYVFIDELNPKFVNARLNSSYFFRQIVCQTFLFASMVGCLKRLLNDWLVT